MCLSVSVWIFAGYNNTNMDFAKVHMLIYLPELVVTQSERFKKPL